MRGGRGRVLARVRLAALFVLLGAFFLRWTTAQTVGGASIERGPAVTGVVGALALLALWTLGATTVVADRPRGRRIGGAIADAAIALSVVLLLLRGHPWLLGEASRPAWTPVFLALLLLALLDLGLLFAGRRQAREVAYIRGAAALLVALLCAVGGALLPALLAAALAVSPLALAWRPSARTLEGLSLGAAVAALLAPVLVDHLRGGSVTFGVYEGWFLWGTICGLLVVLALAGVLVRRADGTTDLA